LYYNGRRIYVLWLRLSSSTFHTSIIHHPPSIIRHPPHTIHHTPTHQASLSTGKGANISVQAFFWDRGSIPYGLGSVRYGMVQSRWSTWGIQRTSAGSIPHPSGGAAAFNAKANTNANASANAKKHTPSFPFPLPRSGLPIRDAIRTYEKTVAGGKGGRNRGNVGLVGIVGIAWTSPQAYYTVLADSQVLEYVIQYWSRVE